MLPHNVARLLALTASICVCVAGCGESYEQRSKREKAVREERARQIEDRRKERIAALAKAHNAEIWHGGSIGWTADLQDQLIRLDHRPIASTARLFDVQRAGESYLLFLRREGGVWQLLDFVLKCERPSDARPREDFPFSLYAAPEYDFVAKIKSVTRSDLFHAEGGSAETMIRWIAEGDCLAVKTVPEEVPSAPPKGSGKKRSQ